MEPATVVEFVSALTEAFAKASAYYTHWKRKRIQQNHYRKPSGSVDSRGTITCALSSSLAAAEFQIKETYDVAFAFLTLDFSTGDAICQALLCDLLFHLQTRVSHLRRAAESAAVTSILNIADVLVVSESVRVGAVKAMAELYSRIAAGRPIPKHLPVPKPRARHSRSDSCSLPPHSETVTNDVNNHANNHVDGQIDEDFDDDVDDDFDDDVDADSDGLTTALTVSTYQMRFQSEPPSPPLTPPTPKPFASDAVSILTASEADGGSSNCSISSCDTVLLRPKVSVFSLFCPGAMALQVDLSKPAPESEESCKCGYRWKAPLPGKTMEDFIILKEGFRMSRRFLAKSHSSRDAFGCILCVSSGRTDTYGSPEALCEHINTSHTKWQILHERDIS